MALRAKFDLSSLKAAAEDLKQMKKSQGQEDAEFPKLTPTGKQETIAGYTCEHRLMGDKQDRDMSLEAQ